MLGAWDALVEITRALGRRREVAKGVIGVGRVQLERRQTIGLPANPLCQRECVANGSRDGCVLKVRRVRNG